MSSAASSVDFGPTLGAYFIALLLGALYVIFRSMRVIVGLVLTWVGQLSWNHLGTDHLLCKYQRACSLRGFSFIIYYIVL